MIRRLQRVFGSGAVPQAITPGDTWRVPTGTGYRFSLKGSPRHYDDVKLLLERHGATVYFGEALTYERGAGVALWRVQCDRFNWLPALYDWWAEIERVEPIQITFHLYLPDNLKYPVMDLREHTPAQVESYIREQAPRGPVGS